MKHFFSAALMLGVFFASLPAFAQSTYDSFWDKDRFQIRARAISLMPDDDTKNVNIGGNVDIGDSAVVPEVDLTYFITDKIGVEAIAATTPHQIYYNGGANLGDVWALPPTVTLQYHPLRGESAFSPYVGAGINYTIFYGEDAGTGFYDLNVEGGFGYALQAGFDYWLTPNWGVNMDAKKVWLDVDATLNGGAIRASTDLDPWVLGAGVAYRF